MSTPAALSKLRVAELRERCQAQGLSVDGTKPILITRLRDALDKSSTTTTNTQPDITESLAHTPVRRSKRISDSAAASPVVEEMTPRKRDKNSSISETLTERTGTPLKRSRLSSSSSERPSTPVRRSRRLSGDLAKVPEELIVTAPEAKIETIDEEITEEDHERNPEVETKKAKIESIEEKKDQDEANIEIVEEKKTTVEDHEKEPEMEQEVEEAKQEIAAHEINQAKAVSESKDQETRVKEGKEEAESNKETKVDDEDEEEQKIQADQVPEITVESETDANPVDKEKKEERRKKKETNDDKENLSMEALLKKVFMSKQIPRQKPKSGRFWKNDRRQFRQIKRDKGQRDTFEQRLKKKEEIRRNQELANMLIQKKNQAKEELRKRIEENKAKKLENERKTEQYQVIKNPAKLKRMKKKQLRMLEKRDILAKSQ